MQPYYERDGITIYHADCRDVLPTLEAGSVDLVLTDPPYSSGGFQEAGKSNGSIGRRANLSIDYDNLSTRGYERLMREVLRWCNQADEIYVFTDWRMWIYTFDVVEAAGWRVRNMLVWDKEQMGLGMPWRSQHELIAFGKRTSTSLMSGQYGNVLQCRRASGDLHPTEKPVALMKALLINSQGRQVLDPFMGAGTTLVAAKELGRQAIGIEICEAYAEIAANRLQQMVLPLEGR